MGCFLFFFIISTAGPTRSSSPFGSVWRGLPRILDPSNPFTPSASASAFLQNRFNRYSCHSLKVKSVFARLQQSPDCSETWTPRSTQGVNSLVHLSYHDLAPSSGPEDYWQSNTSLQSCMLIPFRVRCNVHRLSSDVNWFAPGELHGGLPRHAGRGNWLGY